MREMTKRRIALTKVWKKLETSVSATRLTHSPPRGRRFQMVIRSRARFRLAVHFLMLAIVTAGTDSAVAAGEKEIQLPACDRTFGTLSVAEPEQKWWVQYNLESPEALIKVFVSQCKCFTLVDRGRGLEAALKERELAAGGEVGVESSIGKGQIKAADYVLIPDIVSQNSDAGGKSIGGAFGGLMGR